eukprot:15472939-Alexandrium_andersonii.AAC.1
MWCPCYSGYSKGVRAKITMQPDEPLVCTGIQAGFKDPQMSLGRLGIRKNSHFLPCPDVNSRLPSSLMHTHLKQYQA